MNGITFASIKEGKRYIVLYYQQLAGEISLLRLQVPFPIIVNGEKVCTYKADFVYYNATGKKIIEDAKGIKTDVYKLKKKLLKSACGIDIVEV